MKFADLHLHTTYSDSTFSPGELFREAVSNGIAAIGIVDHDTVQGLEVSAALSGDAGVELIPGIELTTQYAGMEIHILGYLIDYKNPQLLERLDLFKKTRIERVYKIVAKLKEEGVILDPQKVLAMAPEGTVGRMHIARVMVNEGVVNSVPMAFKKYIGDKCRAYVLGFQLSPAQAIGLIKEVGGVAVLAHPYCIQNDAILFEIIEVGIMGLEVYYPEHTQGMVNFYLEVAKKHNLLVTGGSDCHGNAKPDIKVGTVKIPYDLVERLKEATP